MITTEFAYHRPGSLEEAIRLLAADEDAKVVAGGHSLIPSMKLRLTTPSALVDVARLAELHGVCASDDDGLAVGATTTHAEVAADASLLAGSPLLAEVAAGIGDPAVRNRGTIGGSLAHADPAADYPAAILALGARIQVAGPSGTRTVSAEDWFTGMFETALGQGEIVTAVLVPKMRGVAYEKFAHPASGYAIVGVAAVVVKDGAGAIASARVGLTGAVPSAIRLTGLEAALVGKAADEATIAATATGLVDAGELIGDHVASAEYRAALVDALAARAVARAAARA